LPGLGLQAQALADHTALLPKVQWDPQDLLPPRWANDTVAAIRSGILHTLLAGLREFIADWRRRFPQGPLLLTGGDGKWLHPHLGPLDPELRWDPHLVLRGIAGCRQLHRTARHSPSAE